MKKPSFINLFTLPQRSTSLLYCCLALLFLCLGGQCRGQEEKRPAERPQTGIEDSARSKTYKAEPARASSDTFSPYKSVDFIKRKPYILYNRQEGVYQSFDASGKQLNVDWRSILNREGQFNGFNLKGLLSEKKENYLIVQKFDPRLDIQGTQTALKRVDVKVSLDQIRKSALLYYGSEAWQLNYIASEVDNSWYSNYLLTYTTIYVIDEDLLKERGEERLIGDAEHIFHRQITKIYRPDGSLLANLFTDSQAFLQGYLMLLSEDERFVLFGSELNIGDDEGYTPTGPFQLYDLKDKRSYTFPRMDDDDREKFPYGVGYMQSRIFRDSLFQVLYYNGLSGVRFMVDPYGKKLYYRSYANLSDISIDFGRKVVSPVDRNGQIIDIQSYKIESY